MTPPRNVPGFNRLVNVRVESDGTPQGTFIYTIGPGGDIHELDGVTSIAINVTPDDLVSVTLKLDGVPVKVHGELKRLIQDSDNDELVEVVARAMFGSSSVGRSRDDSGFDRLRDAGRRSWRGSATDALLRIARLLR